MAKYAFLALFADFRGVVFCCRQTLINQARVHIFSKFKNHRKVDILPILLVYDTSVWLKKMRPTKNFSFGLPLNLNYFNMHAA